MSSHSFIPFAKPTLGEEEWSAVKACLESGWITTGPKVKEFESEIQAYLGGDCLVSVLSSATAGLELVCRYCFQPGDEVITTPFTFVATVNAIVKSGATPVFVDISPDTFNIDLDAVQAAITPKTKGIIPVHFAGLPVDCDRLYQIAKEANLRVIEDSAHAIGAEFNGQKIGSFGDIQVFSFHPNKNMTTGEGGAVVSRDEGLQKYVNTMRFHGIDREAWNRFSKSGSQMYDVVDAGSKFNMMDMQAALGCVQLKRLDAFNQKRQSLVDAYWSKLSQMSLLKLPNLPKSYRFKHAWHMLNVCLTDKANLSRNEFIKAMKEENVGVGLHYQPVHLFSFYQKQFGTQQGDFPVTESVGERIVSLPLIPTMTLQTVDVVLSAMSRILSVEVV